MSTAPKRILLITNGTDESLPALDYGVWLANILETPVKLIGLIENRSMKKSVNEVVESTQGQLAKLGITFDVQLERGYANQVIGQVAIPQDDLVVVGPLGRPLWLRWLRGRSFRRIMKNLNSPLIYVPASKKQLEHILVCMGGLGYAHNVEGWAIYLAQHTKARLTILHVVEKTYYEYPTATQIHSHWEQILDTDTPQAHNLRLALQNAMDAGISAEIKIRHGDIIHEIVTEVRECQYDLIAMGSQSSSHSIRRLYTPNVTAEVAECISLPVLTSHS